MKNRYYGILSFSVPQKNIIDENIIIKTKKSKGKNYFLEKVGSAYDELIDIFSDKDIMKLVGHSSGIISYEGDFSEQISLALAMAISLGTNQKVVLI